MFLSRSAQYAVSGILRLAALPPDGFCRIEDLLKGTDAPRHAVAKVFQELARRRLLASVRGTGGGFRLAGGTLDRSLMEVVEAVDGPWRGPAMAERGLCVSGAPCPLAEILQPIAEQLERTLRGTRIRDVAATRAPAPAARCGTPGAVPSCCGHPRPACGVASGAVEPPAPRASGRRSRRPAARPAGDPS